MVREIRIYVEGGGQDKLTWRKIREGLSNFLDPLRQLARSRRVQWRIIPCGSRNDTFEELKIGLRTRPEAFHVLLVDSEGPVSQSPLEHLRNQDRWDVSLLTEDQCHLMVQTIEAWLVADPEALASYYGQGFRRNALPKNPDVEAIPKDQLVKKLEQATAKTQKRPYHKIRHCADLLGRLSRDRVRQRARHCELLFRTLEARITAG
ncbi:MAG: DUF4276 family protein [Thermoanaerobaculia bacterium]